MKTKIWLAIILLAIIAGAFWVDDTWHFPSFNFNNDYTYTFSTDTLTSYPGSCRLQYTVKRSDGKSWQRSETVIIVGKTTGYNVYITQNNIRDFRCDINSECTQEIKKDDVWTLTEKVYVYTIKIEFLAKHNKGPHYVIRCVAYDVVFTDPETEETLTFINNLELKVTENGIENHYHLDTDLGKYLGTYVLNFSAVINEKPFYEIKTASNIYKSF